MLALALRGHDAISRWAEEVGPEDPLVARRTDPGSLRARLGLDRRRNLLTASNSLQRNRREASFCFSQVAGFLGGFSEGCVCVFCGRGLW